VVFGVGADYGEDGAFVLHLGEGGEEVFDAFAGVDSAEEDYQRMIGDFWVGGAELASRGEVGEFGEVDAEGLDDGGGAEAQGVDLVGLGAAGAVEGGCAA
jgi:hypothetical protein